jgi:signal transduction histidine kinase
MDVPTALVMKNEYPMLKAIISSRNRENPIPRNYEEKIFGKYCEKTIGSKQLHEVPNAYNDPLYKNKKDLEDNNFISYLGFPLEWPTGDIFGTICVLDQKERHFTEEQKELMRKMKQSVEINLQLIYQNKLLKVAQEKIKYQRDNLRLLTSTVRHDLANNLMFIKGFLNIKIKKKEIPNNLGENLLPFVKSSLDSIEYIKKLEGLFTKKKEFKKIDPRRILKIINDNFPEEINIKGKCMVKADEFLSLLFKELIRNAFKHTNTPKVDITLSESKQTATIEIQDYGSGLPEKIIDSHFQNRSKERELKGLTIIEKIMNRYGGDIMYEKNKKGALFKLIWPKDRIYDSRRGSHI